MKKAAKFFLLMGVSLGILFAAIYAYWSWSQGATSPDADWCLRGILGASSLFFCILWVKADNREKNAFWFFRYKDLYFASMVSFLLIGMTNVSDYAIDEIDWDSTKIIAHFIATGLGILFPVLTLWVYYQGKPKKWARIGIGVGVILFLLALVLKIYSVAWGEVSVYTTVAILFWPLLNVELDKN